MILGWAEKREARQCLQDFYEWNQQKEQQMSTQGTKHDQGKAPMSLLSTEALTRIAEVMDFGKRKYAAHNWRKGMAWSRVLDAALRHITSFNNGEDKDPESGLSHLAHAGCCIMFLLDFEKSHPSLDDRYKQEEKGENKSGAV